jgi:very-short-patch-repair endonuclease
MKRKFNCQECNIEFESNQNRKFCSRSCYAKEDSRRKKEKYTMQEHHNLGRKASDEERERRSRSTSETWKDNSIRNSRINGIKHWMNTHGHAPGWDDKTIIKRNKTVELNGGHNLKGKYGSRKCDITFKEKYGITSAEYRQQKLRSTKKTKPEIIAENLLIQIDANFIPQYKFKNRYFDFGLESKKILIEIDGDYWHSKGILYENMNEQQRTTFRNDRYKDDLVRNSDWKLIRIWASDLENIDINKLQKLLYEQEDTN